MSWKKYGIEEKDLLTPASVLVGMILVSASILFSAGKISFSGSGSGSGIDAVRAVAAGSQAQNAPAGNVSVASRKDAPSEGSGKLQIIEFSDFQCPYCQQFFNTAYKEIKSKYIDTGKATLIYRHYPLPFHQNAQKAAEAGECANRQGKFWQYHDTMFTKAKGDGTGLDVASLKQYAKDLGLDSVKFNSCLDNGETADTVKKDTEDAQKAGVSGTPTFFIKGEKLLGAQPFSSFQTVIDAALK